MKNALHTLRSTTHVSDRQAAMHLTSQYIFQSFINIGNIYPFMRNLGLSYVICLVAEHSALAHKVCMCDLGVGLFCLLQDRKQCTRCATLLHTHTIQVKHKHGYGYKKQ